MTASEKNKGNLTPSSFYPRDSENLIIAAAAVIGIVGLCIGFGIHYSSLSPDVKSQYLPANIVEILDSLVENVVLIYAAVLAQASQLQRP